MTEVSASSPWPPRFWPQMASSVSLPRPAQLDTATLTPYSVFMVIDSSLRGTWVDTVVDDEEFFDAEADKAEQNVFDIVIKMLVFNIDRAFPMEKIGKIGVGDGGQGQYVAAAGDLFGLVIGHHVIGAHGQMIAVLLGAAADGQYDDGLFVDQGAALFVGQFRNEISHK